MTASAAGAPESMGPYRLLEKLGHGGMATVFRGERVGEAGFKKRVAIKRILPQYRRDPSLLERFAAEARTNARLDHPNLVQVIDFGIDPEPYLVLEFVEGVSLSQILQRLVDQKRQLELAAALFIGAEAATGLDHAHRKKDDDGTPLGIVHRDVSPQNVLISNEGAVKVSDFGLVKAADNVLKTASGVSIGKISYMAPEQARGEPIDARADIFSMGVMLWEMLTLRSLIPPDDPGRAAQLLQSGAFEPPSHHNHRVPERLDRLVMQCLAVDPDQRMPTTQQLSLELRELLHEMAAGYGRQQLARLVGWLFPEKGWAIAEPDLPAAQPSTEERLSMPLVTPAAVALQRVADASSAPPPPRPLAPAAAPAARPIPMPSAPGSRSRRMVIVVLSALVVIIGTVAAIAIVAALYFAHRSGSLPTGGGPTPSVTTTPPPTTTTRPPMMPATTATPLSLLVSSPVEGARLFMGARDLGPLPMSLEQRDLTGEPLICVGADHEPRVIRSELIIELMRAQPTYAITLDATDAPDLVAYVRYPGQGIAHLPSGEDLGPVPGVVMIPVQQDQPRERSIVVWDETGVELAPLSLDGCVSDRVCLLTALPTPTP